MIDWDKVKQGTPFILVFRGEQATCVFDGLDDFNGTCVRFQHFDNKDKKIGIIWTYLDNRTGDWKAYEVVENE